MKEIPVTYRPAKPEDLSFIMHNWLSSYRASPSSRVLHSDVYFFEHRRVIEKIAPKALAAVACNPEDSDQIYGFGIVEQEPQCSIVHYVYVKPAYRSLGIGRSILEQMGISNEKRVFCSHWTALGRTLQERFSGLFNPYLLKLGL